MPSDSKIMLQLTKYLEQNDVPHSIDTDQRLRAMMIGNNGRWHFVAYVSHGERFLVLNAYSPINVPLTRLRQVAEYLNRVNWGLCFGNFEMNWEDGQVCLRTSIAVNGCSIPKQFLERLVFSNAGLMDRYLPGLLAVALGNANPKTAVDDAERDPRESVVPELDSPDFTGEIDPPETPNRNGGGGRLGFNSPN